MTRPERVAESKPNKGPLLLISESLVCLTAGKHSLKRRKTAMRNPTSGVIRVGLMMETAMKIAPTAKAMLTTSITQEGCIYQGIPTSLENLLRI